MVFKLHGLHVGVNGLSRVCSLRAEDFQRLRDIMRRLPSGGENERHLIEYIAPAATRIGLARARFRRQSGAQ